MSKILKSTTLGNVKNGGIFKALGKEFVKLDADEHDCLVLAKDIWTKMPFRDGDDPECPNDLRRSDVMKYLGNCLAEFTEKGTPLDTFIPFKIDLQDTTGQTEYGTVEYRIGLLTLRQYGKYWRLIPKVDTPWWLATPYGTPNCSPYTRNSNYVWRVGTDGSYNYSWYNISYGVRPACTFPLHSGSLPRMKEKPGFASPMFHWMICWLKSRAGRRNNHGRYHKRCPCSGKEGAGGSKPPLSDVRKSA